MSTESGMIGRSIRTLIRQRVLVITVTLLIAVLGIFSYRGLIVDVFPDPSPALVQIYTEAEGLAPQEVEQLVSVPVEAAMFGLPRVERIRSTSTYGLSLVNVYFEHGTDIYWARQVLAPRLHEIQEDLPSQAGEPFLGPIATGLGLVYLYYLEGEGRSLMELRTLQDWLVKYELKSVPEVSQVLSIGGEVRQFQVLVDPAALLKYDLTLTEIMDRIESSNRNAAAGFITRGHPFGREMAAFQEEITHMLDDLPGISLNLTQPIAHNLNELLTGSDAQLAVRVVGEDFQELQRLTGEIEAVLGELEGAVDIQTQQFVGQNNLVIHLDRGALARHGVPVERVQRTVEAAIGGVVVGQVYEGRRRFDIFLRFQPEYRGDTRRIHQLLIPLPGGGRIPLGQVARVEETEATRMISREESRRYSTVQCNVRGRDMGRFAEEARGAVAGQVELPAGYIVRWGGQFELQERSRRTFLLVTPLTLLLVSILLYSIFGSIREAAVILINIPLALIGGLAALVLTGQYMSVPASIGFIAIFGILPLLLASGPGAEILLPLATVVVGGLLTSTLVTLIVLPLVYQAVLERTAPHPAGSMTGPEGHGGRAP